MSVSAQARPAISVIVPVYNIEHYLPECLDSLLAQTHRDFEIVVVNDGSTDDSAAIIDRYFARAPSRIRSLRKPNGGLADARNYGIDHSAGTYLAFVDGDDVVRPTMLERMHGCALATGADMVLCGIDNFTDGESKGIHYPEPDMSVFGHSLAEDPRLLYRVDASACNKLYARDLYIRSGIRFPEGLRFEDVPTVYRLLPFASRVEKVDEPLYRYRHRRPSSISSSYDTCYLDLIEGFRLIDDAYVSGNIFDGNRTALLRLHLTHLIAGRYPDLFMHAAAADRRRFIDGAFALLDGRFAGWRDSDVSRELWRNPLLRVISTHAGALAMFSALPTRAYAAALPRLGAFDPTR